MKKQLFTISSIIIGLLVSGSTFAQLQEPADCSTTNGQSYICDQWQSCNNTNWFCTCVANNLAIPYNTTCTTNTTMIKNNVASSFAVSWSIVVFKYKIENNQYTAKHFFLKLPSVWLNPRIKITNLSPYNLMNGSLVGQYWWLYNPQYLVPARWSINVVITGQVISSSLGFDKFHVIPCVTNIGSTSCINQTTNFIWPIANYSIEQILLDPKPIFDRDQAIYEIKIKNNWSKTSNENVILSSVLGNFLGEPQLSLDNNEINSSTNIWQLWQIPSWTTKTYLMKAGLSGSPDAWTIITTTSSITGWREVLLSDNTATSSYTIPTFLDLQIVNIDKTTENPEISWNRIWFSIWYKNRWNEILKDIELNASVDWINLNIKDLNLPDLNPGAMWNTIITWTIDQNFPIWTKFCLSWTISASNETESINNNSFSGICYTFVKSADVNIEATLTNSINTISSWSQLIYEIKISNKWEKTASWINLLFYPSDNQKVLSTKNWHVLYNIYKNDGTKHFSAYLDETESQLETSEDIILDGNPQTESIVVYTGSFRNITLVWWEEKIIYFSTILKEYPINWTSISLSWEALFTWLELDTTNNTFSISYDLPALSDVYIDLQSLPFSGFKIWDTITYIISYGNSGLESARNPEIRLTLPSFVRTDETERNLWKSISAGQTESFLVTGTLTETLAVGTQFVSRANIYVDSTQVTTGNDVSILTSSVIEYDNITFGLTVYNESRQLWNINSWFVRAASGHNISFTINYVNNGNVPANNVNISLPNVWPLTITPFNNPGTIWIWQQGSISIQWRINWTYFQTFNPTATISYNTGTNIIRSVTIEEPYECGDGLITRDEPCDTALNMNYWIGQVCEEQWWVCVLTTKFISNTACIETSDWVQLSCGSGVINLHQPRCHEVTVNKINDTTNSILCVPQYHFYYTPYRIDCWGGSDIFTGYIWIGINNILNLVEKTCTYSNENTATLAQATCQIWSEITTNQTQTACRRSLPACDIEVEAPIVIVDDPDENGTVEVECSTKNWQEASLQIICGNWDKSEIEKDNIMSYTCEYSQSDLNWNNSKIMDIECRVNWAELSCEDEVLLDIGILWVCGDGIRQGYEQCDLLPNWSEIGRYLDEEDTYAPLEYRDKICHNCSIEDIAPAQCLSVFNENISIEKGEYLPFWWRINQDSFAGSDDCNNTSDKGKIIKSSMDCVFEIQKPGEAGNQDTEIIYDKECWFFGSYPRTTYKIFNYFSWYMRANTWAYAVNWNNFSSFVWDDLWEYKLRLKEITYDYCDGDLEVQDSQTDNVCETNFTITKPYLVQKSAFGITPKATDIDLKDFYDINRNDIVTRTDLADVMVLDENDYQSNDVNFMVRTFIDTAEKLAVGTSIPDWLDNKVTSAKKVPNKDIYILYGNGNDITLIKDANVTKPFTLIVKNANLIVDGDIDVNGMFIVNDGKIKFKDDNCNKQQIVKGIFIAKEFDATEKNGNYTLNDERCNAWWLHVKWVLIWWWIENLVEKKRSNLARWFRVSWSEESKRIQRRNMIFNGASVLIEYSPELWQQLPPGADEFTKMLDVYKK